MARKITTESVDAFMSAKPFNKANMSVEVRPFKDETRTSAILKLHGNVIARRSLDGQVFEVCDGNYQSNTTKERLNGLPGVSIHQKNFTWFLNGQEWDGSWTAI